MPDYSKSKIYCIKSKHTNAVYIGSTTATLKHRFRKHRNKYNRYIKNGSKDCTTSIKILKYADATIELIENYPCNSKRELNKREAEYIIKGECVNKVIPYRTEEGQKEYRKLYKLKNKDKIKEYNLKYNKKYCKEYYENNKEKYKQYYEDNKERINKNRRDKYIKKERKKKTKFATDKITCNCGCVIARTNISTHKKSKKHLKLIEQL